MKRKQMNNNLKHKMSLVLIGVLLIFTKQSSGQGMVFNQLPENGYFNAYFNTDYAITALKIGKNGAVWAGTNRKGIWRLDTFGISSNWNTGLGNLWKKCPVLEDKYVNDIKVNKQGHVWIAQSGGLPSAAGTTNIFGGVDYFIDSAFYDPFGNPILNHYGESNGLFSRNAMSLHLDTFIRSTPNPNIIEPVTIASYLQNNFEVYPPTIPYPPNPFYFLNEYEFWHPINPSPNFHRRGGLVEGFYNYEPQFKFKKIRSVDYYPSSIDHFGGYQVVGGNKYETLAFTPSTYTYEEPYDYHGILHLSNPRKTLHCFYKGSNGQILGSGEFPISFSNTFLQSGARVRAIHYDKNSRVWLGMDGGAGVKVASYKGFWGLTEMAYNLEEVNFKEVNFPSIFPSGAIVNFNAIDEDPDGRIYFGTTKGVVIFNKRHELLKGSYNLIKGTLSNPTLIVNIESLVYDTARKGLWVGTNGKGVEFWPKEHLFPLAIKLKDTAVLPGKIISDIEIDIAPYNPSNHFQVEMSVNEDFTNSTILFDTAFIVNQFVRFYKDDMVFPEPEGDSAIYYVRLKSTSPIVSSFVEPIKIYKKPFLPDTIALTCRNQNNLKTIYDTTVYNYKLNFYTKNALGNFISVSNNAAADTGTYFIIAQRKNISYYVADTAILILKASKNNIGLDTTILRCLQPMYNLTSMYPNKLNCNYSYQNYFNFQSISIPNSVGSGTYLVIEDSLQYCKDTAKVTIVQGAYPDIKSYTRLLSSPSDVYSLSTTQILYMENNNLPLNNLVYKWYHANPIINSFGSVDSFNVGNIYTGGDLLNLQFPSGNGALKLIAQYNEPGFSVGCKDTALLLIMPITGTLTGANDSLIANYETTDNDGWTHYYHYSFSPAFPGVLLPINAKLLLSLKLGSNNIGHVNNYSNIGNTGLIVKVGATSLAGTPTQNQIINPLITNAYYGMNRYWNVIPTNQPTTPVEVKVYFSKQDVLDLKTSLFPMVVDSSKLVFYKTDGNPNPDSDLANANYVQCIMPGTQPETDRWVLNLGSIYNPFY